MLYYAPLIMVKVLVQFYWMKWPVYRNESRSVDCPVPEIMMQKMQELRSDMFSKMWAVHSWHASSMLETDEKAQGFKLAM